LQQIKQSLILFTFGNYLTIKFHLKFKSIHFKKSQIYKLILP